MDTKINQGGQAGIDRLRQDHLLGQAVHLQKVLTEAMLNVARKGGIVPNAQLKQMCAEFAAAGADAVMQEMAVVQTTMRVTPEDMAGPRETTQEVIERLVKPTLAAQTADAAISAGLVRPILAIPPAGALAATFAGFALILRPGDGPASLPNAPRLDYGKGTTVIPKARGFEPVPGIEGLRR